MPTLFLYTSKRAISVFAQTFGERNFRQKLLTRQYLCSLGGQLFGESTSYIHLTFETMGAILAYGWFAPTASLMKQGSPKADDESENG